MWSAALEHAVSLTSCTPVTSEMQAALVDPVVKDVYRSDPAGPQHLGSRFAECMQPPSISASSAEQRMGSGTPVRRACKNLHPHMSIEHQLFALRHDRCTFQKQPSFTASVNLKNDSVQHPLLDASLQRKGVHGTMLEALLQSLCLAVTMSMKVCSSSGASGHSPGWGASGVILHTVQHCSDDLCGHLQAENPLAGVQC